MVRKGYDKDFATILTICTAIMAPIIPPSIVAVIYAWMADESVAAIFAGGYLPGLLVGIGMAVPYVHHRQEAQLPKEPPPTRAQFVTALRNALPAIMIPADHHGRHHHRLVHADRGRRGGGGVRPRSSRPSSIASCPGAICQVSSRTRRG